MKSWKQSLLRTRAILPALVFLSGLTVTAAIGAWLYRGISEGALTEFQRMSTRTASEIEARFRKSIYGLNGARGLYAASRTVERAEFRAYVESRDLAAEFPGVRGFGFIQQVLRADVDRFAKAERQGGVPGFTVRQLDDTSHATLYILKYMEPLASNAEPLGLDIGSEPLRRAAAQQAADTGLPTISGAVTLLQDNTKSPAVVVLVPVYRHGSHATTVAERRAALVGLLFAPIVVADLMVGMPDTTTGLLDFEVYDSPVSAPNGVLMFDADDHVSTQLAAGRSADAGRDFSTRQALFLPGREFTLSMNSTQKFDASIDYRASWFALVGGALLSAMLALMLRQQINGRQKAEARARAMTADLNRLAEVVKHTSNAVSTADRQGRITWINEGFTTITGYTAEEAVGKTPAELLGSGKADAQTLKTLVDAARNGQSCRVEILNRAKGGREYWTDTEIQPQFDDQGQHTGFMEIGIDITEHRQSKLRLEAALRDSDALLGTLNLHAIISTSDALGSITQVNDAFCDVSGYTRDELVGSNHRIVNSGTHSQAFWADMWKTIATGMPWRGELCNRAKDGRLYWADTFIAPFIGDDGKIDRYISIRTDITHSKKAQAEVQSSRELLIGSIEAVDEAFVLFDPEDRLVLCNQNYRDTYQEVAHLMVPGARFEDIIRAGAEYGQYPDSVGRLEEWVAERLAAHQSGDTTLVQKLANGRTLRIIERKLPDGHIVGFRVDISELVWANEAAQAASQSKSQFLANMSHEIRTPMNAILGMLTLLRKTALTPKQADYAAKSEGAARALLGLINEILDFSKIEAGKMALDPQPFAMDQMLRDLSVLLSASLGAKPVELLFDIDPKTPARLIGDSMRIQQVLLNLGSNAIKFTSEGEVVLGIKVVQQDGDAAALRFSMRDSGIGIAAENQARIFSGFTQAEASTTRRYGGTGLGVAISKRFVRMMGGELELQSALGEGSLFFFTITLRLAQDPPAPPNPKPDSSPAPSTLAAPAPAPVPMPALMLQDAPADAPPSPPRLARMRLLLVEDNHNNQQVARELLEYEGATVQVANNGQEGVQAVAAANPPFDVVLMDLQMPLMDGFAATRHIRTELGLDALPIVAMTANAMASDRAACLAAGMNDHIAKPFDLNQLVQVLRAQACWTDPDMGPDPHAVALTDGVSDAAERSGIDLPAALARLGGKHDIYQRMLTTFMKDLGTMPAQLRGFAEQALTADAKRMLHTLKGLAATLGATELAAQAAQCEKHLAIDTLPTGSPGALAHAVQQACLAIEHAKPGLKALVDALHAMQVQQPRPSAAAEPRRASFDAPALVNALQVLEKLLRNGDMQAMQSLADLQQQFGVELGAQLDPLSDATAELDFETAALHCAALAENWHK